MADHVTNGEPRPGVEVTPAVRPPDLAERMRQVEEAVNRPLPEEMSVSQAADYLDLSREKVLRLIRKGELPCRKDGKRRRIPSEAVVKYLKEACDRGLKAWTEEMQHWQEMGWSDVEPHPSQEPK